MTRASRARATSERPRPSMQDLPFLMQDLPKGHHVESPGVDRGRAPRMRLSSAPARSGARSSASCVFTASPRPRFRAGSGKMGCACSSAGNASPRGMRTASPGCWPMPRANSSKPECCGRSSASSARNGAWLCATSKPQHQVLVEPHSTRTRGHRRTIECTADTPGGFARADGHGR